VSQRTDKVESLVQQIVAQGLLEELGPEGARITVTGVEVAPDLRHATVWLGIISGSIDEHEAIFNRTLAVRSDIQKSLAKQMTTKFVPHLYFRPDAGGEYAEHMEEIFKQL
jgi:ribosome-binding factor A